MRGLCTSFYTWKNTLVRCVLRCGLICAKIKDLIPLTCVQINQILSPTNYHFWNQVPLHKIYGVRHNTNAATIKHIDLRTTTNIGNPDYHLSMYNCRCATAEIKGSSNKRRNTKWNMADSREIKRLDLSHKFYWLSVWPTNTHTFFYYQAVNDKCYCQVTTLPHHSAPTLQQSNVLILQTTTNFRKRDYHLSMYNFRWATAEIKGSCNKSRNTQFSSLRHQA
jgi:hypothetical protein